MILELCECGTDNWGRGAKRGERVTERDEYETNEGKTKKDKERRARQRLRDKEKTDSHKEGERQRRERTKKNHQREHIPFAYH